jgi:hypothetical protein
LEFGILEICAFQTYKPPSFSMHANRYDNLDNLPAIIIVLPTFLSILYDYIEIDLENKSIANA